MSTESSPSTAKPRRLRRWLAIIGFVASLAIFIFAWAQRGYAVRLRIAESGKFLTPLAFSPTGGVLAVHSQPSIPEPEGNQSRAIRFFRANDGAELQPSLPVNPNTESAHFSPDGNRLAVVERIADGKLLLIIYDWPALTRLASQEFTYGQTGNGRPGEQVTVRFSPDSRFIVWSGVDWSKNGTVGVLDLVTGKKRFSLDKTWGSVVSPDSRRLATLDDPTPGNPNGMVKLWNAESGELERSIPIANRSNFVAPDFSPDGHLVAYSGWGPKVEIFEASTGQRIWSHQGPDSSLPLSARFLSRGQAIMIVAGFDVEFWDTKSWKLTSSHKFDNRGRPAWQECAIPNSAQAAVVINNSGRYQSFLRWLGRVGHLNTFGTGQLCILDATNGASQTVELHEISPVITNYSSYGSSEVWSPDGTKVVFAQFGHADFDIWDLPPQPSYVAPIIATALVVGATLLLLVFLRRTNRGVGLSELPPTDLQA